MRGKILTITSNQQSAIKEQLDAIQHDSRKLAGESSKGIEDLRSMLSDIMIQLRYEHNDTLMDPSLRDAEISQLGKTLSESLLALNSKIVALPKEMAVLRRLSFDAMFRRQDEVSGPGHGTFEWILEGIANENTRHTKWSNDFSDNERTKYDSVPESPSGESIQKYAESSTWNSEGGMYGFQSKWTQSIWSSSYKHSESEADDNSARSDDHDKYDERDENRVIFGRAAGKQFVPYANFDFNRHWHDADIRGLGSGDPEHQILNDSIETQGSYSSNDSSISDWSDSVQHREQGPKGKQALHATQSSTKDAPTLKLHGVYYRSGPSISKIHGNEPLSQYSQYNGWAPHLDHIMSVSERAKRRLISNEFSSFLRDSQGVYFCCGKAGSGKSTFMKYISGHQDVLKQLKFWSGSKRLVVISIFFWNSGDELQMSIEGFYRSLLFQVVQQCPEILPELFPEHQMRGAEHVEGIRGTLLPFRFFELQQAIRRLLKTSEFPTRRLCFFIDGLDEFKGESREHVAFAQLLKQWATKDVKIVCSARPHIEFLDTFTDPYRTIQLHEWTKDDIYRHVSSELNSGLGSDKMSTGSLARLADMVSRRADGVFIWAQLVLESLLDGIAHRDSMKALQERVDQTPRDLNLLYARILDSIDSTVRRRAEDALFLVARNPDGMLNALAFSWLDDLDDGDFPLNRPFQIYTRKEVEDRIEIARHQVALLTKGLVEIRKFDNIYGGRTAAVRDSFFHYQLAYHHLTAHDFLMARAVTSEGLRSSEILRDRYARLTLAEVKFSGALWGLLGRFRTIYSTGVHTYHEIPDRFLDELGACYPTADTSQDSPHRATHVGFYAAGSHTLVQIELSGRREYWRENISTCHLVWKGSDASLLICYALSLQQAGYVVRRLQKGAVNELTDEELATWLLATWTIFPDPAITEHVLSCRGLPQRPIEVRNYGQKKSLEISCWFGFLLSFCCATELHATIKGVKYNALGKLHTSGAHNPHSWNEPWPRLVNRTWIEMHCHNLENLLRHGVDKDVRFILGDMVINESPDKMEAGTEWNQWVVDQGTTVYTDLLTIIQLIQPPPPNLGALHELLGASPLSTLRNTASRFWGQTWGRSRGGFGSFAAKEIHKVATLEDLKNGKFEICGIESADEVLMGPLRIFVY